MTDVLITALGWFGQACFFSRFLLQWGKSERAKRIVVPVSFWWLSLVGSVGLVVYTFWAKHPIFAIGAVINLVFYARNLAIHYGGRAIPGMGWIAAVVAGLLIWIALAFGENEFRDVSPAWVAVGALGMAIWISRFPFQWWVAEREGKASLTFGFFLLSAFGSVILLAYAIKRDDWVLIAGQAFGPFLYGRNLWLAAKSAPEDRPWARSQHAS